uniref:Uncharacterized protein n=1 Tax=Fundulus heteroclitus TaxID=8078 RepID=A0A3Q2R3A4_FUNHE
MSIPYASSSVAAAGEGSVFPAAPLKRSAAKTNNCLFSGNYGGVYVGLPADLTTVAASQSKSTRKGEHLQCIF